jgi:prepilin-type N-terminal cleavage/methylation domain-containing protein
MKYENDKNRAGRRLGFTLVEMLVVMGIIAVLAAMIFPITAAVNKRRNLNRAKAELSQVEMAIQNYNTKLGHYPPDNPANAIINALYYELLGTQFVNNGTAYQTMDGSAQINTNAVPGIFGVSGFVNCSRGTGDEAQPGIKFSQGFTAGQYVDTGTAPNTYRLLGCAVDGPEAMLDSGNRKISPYWYNCSSQTNNPNSFDLWLDLSIGSHGYRVSNWSATPVTLW